MSKLTSRAIVAGWAALPVGAIWTIVTGDLRAIGIGLVLFMTSMVAGGLVLEAERRQAAAQEIAKANAQRLLDALAERARERDL